VVVEPCTKWINAFTPYGPDNLLPYEAAAVQSCEGVVGFVQWTAALAMMLCHILLELRARRQFLSKQAASATSARFRGASQVPGTRFNGVFAILAAFVLPILIFLRLWQVWLKMLAWVAEQWSGVQGPLPAVLRLPYLFLA
jgi:hypothetical protein